MNESWKKTSSCRLLEVIYDEIVPYSVVYFLICKFSMLLFLYQVIANTSAFYNYKTMHDYANMVKTVCRRIVSLHEHLCSFLKRLHTYGDMEHLQIYSMFGFTCFLNPTRNMWEFPLFFCNEGIQNTILPTKSALCSLDNLSQQFPICGSWSSGKSQRKLQWKRMKLCVWPKQCTHESKSFVFYLFWTDR